MFYNNIKAIDSCFISEQGDLIKVGQLPNGLFEEHRLIVKNSYKKFGITIDEAKQYSSYKLLELAVCRGWITARWGSAANHGETDNDNVFIRVNSIKKAGKRLTDLLMDIAEIRGGDTKLFIEEYGDIPFVAPPRITFSGTLLGTLKEFLADA